MVECTATLRLCDPFLCILCVYSVCFLCVFCVFYVCILCVFSVYSVYGRVHCDTSRDPFLHCVAGATNIHNLPASAALRKVFLQIQKNAINTART